MQSSLNWQSAMFGDRVKRLMGYWSCLPTYLMATVFFAFAALLSWRRVAGAIHEPLSASGIVSVGILLILVAYIAHKLATVSSDKKRSALFSEIAISLALLAVGAALSVPHTSVGGLIAFWSIILLEEGWSWRVRSRRGADCQPALSIRQVGNLPHEPQTREDIATPISARQEPRPPKTVELHLDSVEAMPEAVTQQLTRSTAADGADEFAGWLRASFAAGQRTLSVHLAFCPPFARTPELTVEQIDGPEARIKTAQVLPYGARLDLKLSSVVESSAAVVLQFSARAEGGVL